MTRRSTRRLVVLCSAVLLFGVAAAAVHVTARAAQVRDDLTAAAASAVQAAAALRATDPDGAAAAVARMSTQAREADAGDDPLWRLAEAVPVIGPNLAAARGAASGLHRLGDEVAGPLLETAVRLSEADLPGSGAVLREAAPRLEAADRVRAEVQDALAGLDRNALVGPVAEGLAALDDAVAAAEPVTAAAARAAAVLPTVLGLDGPRTVLVMVQNTAELRTGGGITGTFLQLDVAEGRATLAEVRESAQFAPVAEPLVPLRAGEVRAYGDGIGRFVQNASMTADFDLTGRLASAWWAAATGTAPDLVVSVDPLVLAALLEVVGPVETADGPLAADAVIDRLLVEPYLLLSPEEQSARFAEVADAAFAAVLDRGDPLRLAAALAGPIAEGRLSVWSAHPAEQELLAGTPVAGPLARHRQAGPGAFAVYFNDATGGKLTPYLQVGLAAASAVCRADGRADVLVTVEVGNALAPDAVATLPASVTGDGIWGAAVGDIAPTVTVVAPPGWFLGGVRLDGEPAAHVAAEDDGQPAVTRRTDLHPGRTRTLEFRFIAPDTAPVEPVLVHTPLLGEPAAARSGEVCAAG